MSLSEFDEIKFNHTTKRLDFPSSYLLKKARRNPSIGIKNLRDSFQSATIYIGNLSFLTTEEQIYELFNKVGEIKKIIMGLDKFKYTPCGFCFIIFKNHRDSINAVKYLNNTKLDDRYLQIDLDPGFTEGRQFGRGTNGGQVSDELRYDFDEDRGGYGKQFVEGNINNLDVNFRGDDFNNNNNNTGIEHNSIRFGARRKTDSYIPSDINKENENIPEDVEVIDT
ncbi:hypothetical protein WICMUC_000389 [Wickerhamomyces mucosus]|uniref:Nuclear cap-binding protein subunit 2 n=1 Tax=Wickerhamomyces mucosus TaxID=1378264 RepID=A0A9P8PZB1_9ASCO|nr:hypothetical protein WICMUC_000389 [Wickerhamomyces mucosus]